MDHSGSGASPPREPERSVEPADLSDARRAQAGDVRAFERLYRAHVGRVHGLARRMIGWEGADEVTQDVFVRAWQKIGSYRGEAAFGTWLHRLAVNVMLTRRSWLGTQRSRWASDDAAIDSAHAVPVHVDAGLDMERAIARLPEGARRVFVLHDVEGYRHEEIARLLGVTSGTTKAQLHRARHMLRRHLTPAETT